MTVFHGRPFVLWVITMDPSSITCNDLLQEVPSFSKHFQKLEEFFLWLRFNNSCLKRTPEPWPREAQRLDTPHGGKSFSPASANAATPEAIFFFNCLNLLG